MRPFLTAVLASVIALGACAPPSSSPSTELPEMDARFDEAFNTGDVDGLVMLYGEDARLMPPNTEMAQGRDAIRAAFGEMMESGFQLELEPIESVEAADIGYQVGTYALQGPDGTTLDRGKYMETWQQIAGEWKLINDIWNSDMPATPEGQTVIFTHQVRDAQRWLAAWQGPDSRHEMFAQHGAPSVRVFQSQQNPRLTGLLVTVADMGELQAFLESPEAQTAKAEDGVVDATLRVFTEIQ